MDRKQAREILRLLLAAFNERVSLGVARPPVGIGERSWQMGTFVVEGASADDDELMAARAQEAGRQLADAVTKLCEGKVGSWEGFPDGLAHKQQEVIQILGGPLRLTVSRVASNWQFEVDVIVLVSNAEAANGQAAS